MLHPSIKKNDRRAKAAIYAVSIIVFIVITILGKYNLSGKIELPFDEHIFAKINAVLNASVALLLIAGLFAVKKKNYELHKNIMLTALTFSVLFLLSYICHHLFAGDTAYGETDGIKGLSAAEQAAVGTSRTIYLAILLTHIPLAGIALPFILFAAYRALIGEYEKHKRLVRVVWPLWFYVAITGVIVYLMVNPYYR